MDAMTITQSDWTAAGWDAHLGRSIGGSVALQQSGCYGAIAAAGGCRVVRYSIWRNGRLIGAAQVLQRRGLAWLGRGPVWQAGLSPAVKRTGLRSLARALFPLPLIATAAHCDDPPSGVPLVTQRAHAMWDLGPCTADLQARLYPKWRNAMLRALRSDLVLTQEDDPAWLVGAEAAQRKARGYSGLPSAFVEAWASEGGGRLALALRDAQGQPHAGMVFLCHGDTASYHLGWRDPRRPTSGVHAALLWQSALWLRAGGMAWLDLGGVDSTQTPGLMRFKLGTGAGVHTLGATTWVFPAFSRLRPDKATRMCDSAQ
ncbi:GNAT family N-acetyltransferase [Rhodobacteraceae bacterium]|nr:GNAT family N-acetyltransferase [Paracoccaceae bacterium]